MTRVAVDLLGGDGEPGAVVDGVVDALGADQALEVSVVGPPRITERLLAERGPDFGDRLRVVAASQVVGPGEDAAREVRSRRDATVRVAARLVRDGAVDAMVSAGPSEAVVAASSFALGPLPGATRPALAVVLGSSRGPTVLLDAGAAVDANADHLAQCAVIGSNYATICLRVARPRIGLLSAGPGRWDGLRRGVGDLITELGLDFIGAVDAATVVAGGEADVVVSDGFTGAVLVSCLRAVAPAVAESPWTSSGWYLREGAFVVGVDGIVVVVGGRPVVSGGAVARAIADACAAQRVGWMPRQRAVFGGIVAHRRVRAGLSV
ncbi:phosphate starvation-inducible protein PhoH [Frankia sp. Cppng1_Ct_nod]|uniref:phosphate starvation-inducible protein PhoH n=1 Tax=Frankia sp. Cppng1_Ct_nod TaxID=2897162 RepID=UPI0013EF98B8|nr:phosphate starvation-inducible protein PhoH [Frankia sp. Cppng1_Ct_nod]